MTTKEILNLDCRESKNKEIIQKVLRKIKPLSRYSDEYDIPFEAIEKAINIMSKKYSYRIRDVVPDVWGNESNTIWHINIIHDVSCKTIGTVHGITLYEAFAKAAIKLYSEIKKV